MPPPLAISLYGLAAASVLLAIYWAIVLLHVVRTSLRIPTARAGLTLATPDLKDPASAPTVCVIIPAHNEAASIDRVAHSLLAQDYPNIHAVFALDRCTDATRPVLETALKGSPRAEIIDINHCPPDWAGKVHAIWTASRASQSARQADILVFIDADTTIHESGILACVALLRARTLGMLSLLSTQSSHAWFERIVQPAAAMELIRQYPIERANAAGDRRRAFANGQFIMFTRDAYAAVGGHEAVKSALLEDIDLARQAARFNIPAGLFLADGMHHCRMYDTWPQFTRGWKRIYIEAANRKPARLRAFAARVSIVGVWLPLAAVGAVVVGAGGLSTPQHDAARIALWSGAVALGLMLLALALIARAGRAPPLYSLTYPLGAWLTSAILRSAAKDLEKGGKTVWGGREYELTPR